MPGAEFIGIQYQFPFSFGYVTECYSGSLLKLLPSYYMLIVINLYPFIGSGPFGAFVHLVIVAVFRLNRSQIILVPLLNVPRVSPDGVITVRSAPG